MDSFFQQQYQTALALGRPKHGAFEEFSLRHPAMPLCQRAKIFSPFDALDGFREAIDKKRRLYVEKRELTEEEQENLNRTIQYLHERTANRRMAKTEPLRVTVTYYKPSEDECHEAYGCRGTYERFSGTVWKVDALLRKTILIGDREIELDDVALLSIEEES